jgi:hypothetical protein
MPVKTPMKLSIRGKHRFLPNKAIRAYLQWLFRDLMPDRADSLRLTVSFQKLRGFEAICYASENNETYRINIDPKLTKLNTMCTLAHEMVHVRQYATGQLSTCVVSGSIIWKGRALNNRDYWTTPWEIEAYGREVGLYARYREWLRNQPLTARKSANLRALPYACKTR